MSGAGGAMQARAPPLPAQPRQVAHARGEVRDRRQDSNRRRGTEAAEGARGRPAGAGAGTARAPLRVRIPMPVPVHGAGPRREGGKEGGRETRASPPGRRRFCSATRGGPVFIFEK